MLYRLTIYRSFPDNRLVSKKGQTIHPEISVILPCRNEEQALPHCINSIREIEQKYNLSLEIIVSDSSTDRSPDIAKEMGAKVVEHGKIGYGVAYLEGIARANGDYLFMADADNTYDFREIPTFVEHLRGGYDFVIGNRFQGVMARGAMPWSHKYIGNPILSGILRMLFGAPIRDSHCGMRAIKKSSFKRLRLKTTGMEFASEMVISAIKKNLKILELPIDYHLRIGDSKLRSFSDGWRHLRFMLLYSPFYVFFIPGLLLFLLGAVGMVLGYFDLLFLGSIKFYYHPLFFLSKKTCP